MPTSMLESGQIFAGRYRVIRLIAHGGMGAVFEAEHTGTERHVALKLLWPHVMAVQSAREKFELEAKVAARVQSEHIVHVLDAGFDEATSSPYLVMELLQGDTLAAFVTAQERLTPELTVQLLQQVAKGLDAAHALRDAKGARTPLIHRDLKPENLLLVPRNHGLPLVKVLDFGISKVLSESRNMSHEIRGTPMYMAYEQVSAEKLSPQTDIWPLGLIAYYMLTGRSYWKSANDPEASMQALFMEILMAPIAPASQRLLEQGADFTLPAAFDDWLMRCIDRVPEQRFESASAAIIALEAALRVQLPASASVHAGAPAGIAQRVAAPARLSRTATAPEVQVIGDLRASTVGSMPALESQSWRPHSGLAEAGVLGKLRERPLLAALALGALLSTLVVVALLREGDPMDAAPASGAPLSPPEAMSPIAAPPERAAPAAEGHVVASPQLHAIPADSQRPPVEPARQPETAEKQPVRSTQALRPTVSPRAVPPRVADPPSPAIDPPSSAAAPAKHTNAKKPRSTPAAPPLNPFDMR